MEKMTSKESLDRVNELKKAMDECWDYQQLQRIEKEWMEAIKQIVPEVGMGCTVVYYSDYRAATVVEVNGRRNRVGVKFNKTKCLDYYAGDYEILPEMEERMAVRYFTKRKNGEWVYEGHTTKDGVKLALHYQHHYIDPTF